MSLRDAFSKLRDQNLCVAVSSEVDLDGGVTAQSPEAGTSVTGGSAVTLSAGSSEQGLPVTGGPERLRVPAAVGLTLRDALERLTRAHLLFVEFDGPVSLGASNAPALDEALVVSRQSPRPGAWMRQARPVIADSGPESRLVPVVLRLRERRSSSCSS